MYQNTYKYTLNVIDEASRYKARRPLKTKKAREVVEMFNFTAFIERLSKTLSERLLKAQDAQELQNPTDNSKIWVSTSRRL